MEITVLGAHNSESKNTRCAGLLIDGIVALDAGGLTSSLTFEELLKIKAVILTHGHYDHVRDIPALGMDFYLRESSFDLYSTDEVYQILMKYFLDGVIYPAYLERPPEKPTIRFHKVKPMKTSTVEGYKVLPVPVGHALPAVGYQFTAKDGKSIFYTGDTGPGLAECWKAISPNILFIEVTGSSAWEKQMTDVGHMTPPTLRRELLAFKKLKGYLPTVIVVHMNPVIEDKIKEELCAVSEEVGTPILPAFEGMQIKL